MIKYANINVANMFSIKRIYTQKFPRESQIIQRRVLSDDLPVLCYGGEHLQTHLT